MMTIRMYFVVQKKDKEELIHGDFRLSRAILIIMTYLKLGGRLKFVNFDSCDRDNNDDMYCRLHGYHLAWYWPKK